MELHSIDTLINEYEELSVYTESRVREAVDDVIRKYGITFEQLCILRMLCTRPGMNSISIAERLHINKSGVSIRINRLINRKLIEKKKIDNRSFGLYQTNAGKEIYEKAQEKIRALVSHWIKMVGEKDAATFIRIYRKINEIIIQSGAGS
ncbi:MarR family winged helix-turn-helix transcriptional regulator [Sporolactobacillus sp. THM19-2]|uniref:MarR family winged helix-turn-helix transcriptional regulator n=1 Tax=Sporolactobacillus sp. THM19-2 TaxID=2511171 RepID=UPI00101E9BA2|nr:MarR family transcriptional regulator [Sporolactobacillus sp. THM19-2]RYL94090.1 MarR family transcriptional regulator [Sporolactobacillus sp. THM19-2]